MAMSSSQFIKTYWSLGLVQDRLAASFKPEFGKRLQEYEGCSTTGNADVQVKEGCSSKGEAQTIN